MIYYIALTIIHYANVYFHNYQNNYTINRLTITVDDLKKEIESIKTQLERKHIIEETSSQPIQFYKKITNFFWPSQN